MIPVDIKTSHSNPDTKNIRSIFSGHLSAQNNFETPTPMEELIVPNQICKATL